jgi:hypothetical protein
MEGTRESDTLPTDIGLLGVLHPSATRYTVVPAGGKGNVIRVVQELRGSLPSDLGLRVFGVVDADRAGEAPAGIIPWPFASIENLLLNSDAIATAALRLLDEATELTPEGVAALIEECAHERRNDEVRLRVSDALGARTVRLAGATEEDVATQIEQEAEALRRSGEEISAAVSQATAAVDGALNDGSYLSKFRGKQLLRCVYGRLRLGDRNISYKTFSYAVASVCSERGETRQTLDAVFSAIDAKEAAASPIGE